MKHRMAYRYRILPNREQRYILAQVFGCSRFIYNWAVGVKSRAWKEEKKKVSYNDLSKMLTALKKQKGYEFLNNVSSVPIQQTLRHVDRAFVNFFQKRARYPRHRHRSGYQSAEYTASAFTLTVSDETIRCPDGRYRRKKTLRLARMKDPMYVVWHREIPPGVIPKTVTISRTPSHQYYASFFCEVEIEELPRTDQAVGIDFGVKSTVVTSDEEVYSNPRFFDREARQLARLQRRLSKSKRGGKNSEKARRKVARKHAKIANRRKNYQHTLTKSLVTRYDTIVVEKLNLRGMVKNRRLAKALSSVGIGEIVRQLQYKAAWYGRSVIQVDTFFPSSKMCHNCGQIKEELTLDVRIWECPNCGATHDRDRNAAKNILREGTRQTQEKPLVSEPVAT